MLLLHLPLVKGLVAKGLVAKALVAKHLVAKGLVAKHLVAKALVAKHLVAKGLVAKHLVAKGLVAKHLVAKGLVAKGCSLLLIQTWCPIQVEFHLKKGTTAIRPNFFQIFVRGLASCK